jgi:hypothetical protein
MAGESSSPSSIWSTRPMQGCSRNSAPLAALIWSRSLQEFFAGQGARRCQHADLAVAGGRSGRLQARLDADDGHGPDNAPQQLDGGHGGRIAGHDQRLGALREQEAGDGQRAFDHHVLRLVAVGRKAGIGQVEQVFVRQLARMWRSTDRPPTPESKMPIGASAGNGHGNGGTCVICVGTWVPA